MPISQYPPPRTEEGSTQVLVSLEIVLKKVLTEERIQNLYLQSIVGEDLSDMIELDMEDD